MPYLNVGLRKLLHHAQLSRYTLVTHNLATHPASIHLDGTGDEVGRVVGIEQLTIILLGIALGQEERFGDTAIGGDVGEVETREEAIVTTTGEEKPAAVAAPGMKTLCLLTVDLVEGMRLTGLHVVQPEVCLGVPHGEIAVVCLREQNITTVVGGTRPRGALACQSGTDKGINLLTQAPCLGIEGYAAKTVALLIVVRGVALTLGSGEVEPTAIRREGRGVFCPTLLHGEGVEEYGMILDIIDKDIGRVVVDLYTFRPCSMEGLEGLVGGEGTIATTGMPIGIDHCSAEEVALSLEQLVVAVVMKDCGTMGTTDMENILVGIGMVGGMAVDALTTDSRIFQKDFLGEGGEIALVDAHLAPHLVARSYATIGDSEVDAVGTDIEREGAVGMPAVGILGRDADAERVANRLSYQLVPVVEVEIGRRPTLAVQAVAVAVGNDSIDEQGIVVGHREVERGDIDRYGDADIVGIDGWLVRLLVSIADGLCAGGKEPQDGGGKRKEDGQIFSHAITVNDEGTSHNSHGRLSTCNRLPDTRRPVGWTG